MNERKYLVTGGAGFIGRALVQGLIKQGHQVRILDNQFRGSVHDLHGVENKIEFVLGDIRILTDVLNAVIGVDGVFHLAFVNGTEFFYSKPELVLEVGVKGIMNIMDACLQCRIKEFYLASSSEVYQTPSTIPTNESTALIVPDPFNPRYSYGGGKLISELVAINYARKHFDKMVIFRPHNVYGPNMGWEHVIPQFIIRMKDLCSKTKNQTISFPLQGTGTETRAFCYIDDFIDGVLLLRDKGQHNNIYHIGSEEEISTGEVAKKIGSHFNRELELFPSDLTLGSTPRRCPDISKMRSLGFKPKVSLDQGLKQTIDWYVNQPEVSSRSK